MPVYNGQTYLAHTLDSVLAQTYTDFVLYITDNASTDRTAEICKEYAAKDSRIVYMRNPENVGAAGNYERCFLPAKSEYFRWQNADDPIEPTLIEECIKFLDEHPDYVLAYGKSNIMDADNNITGTYDDNLHLPQERASERFITCLNVIGLQNLMYGLIRREALGHTARMKAYMSADINLIVELTLYGKFHEIPKHLFHCRRHPECSSWDMSDTEKLTNFWAPSKRKLIMQTWRSMYEYYKAVFRAPIPFSEKTILYKYLLKYGYWRKSQMLGELQDLVKFGILRIS